MKTKLLTFAALALLASSTFAATPIYLYRLYSPGVKGTATAPADSLVPTAGSVFATWNPSDKGTNITLSGSNLTAVGITTWSSVRATQGKASGKWYWESTITGANDTNSGYFMVVGNSTFGLSSYGGNSTYGANSLGWIPGGTFYYLNWTGTSVAASPASVTYPVGTTFMMAMDLDNDAIYMGVNGIWNGNGVPTSGSVKTGAALQGFTGTVFPAVSSVLTQSTANFGASPFKYAVPAGYHAGVFQ